MSEPETAPTDDLRKALREEFGLERLRHGQEEVMRGVLAGRSVLAVMPTGAGKSLCYQLPGLQLEGTTVIVSPLISLMKDQVDKLVAMGHAARRPPAAGESPFETGLAEAVAAERRIVDALPELGEAARDPELRKSFRQALGRARDRLERLAEVRRPGGRRPAGPEEAPGSDDGTADEVLEALLSHGRRLSAAVRGGRDGQSGSDDALLAVARRIVEHRTAAYGRLALSARKDGHEPQADDLDEIVARLAESGERLAGLVVGRIHPAASRDLDDLTRDQLYERAREIEVPGRSKMNKAELQRAVAKRAGSAAM